MDRTPIVGPGAALDYNAAAVATRHALDVAGQALNGVPPLIAAFQRTPGDAYYASIEIPEVHQDTARNYGVVPGAQDPDPGTNVPVMRQAYWRDQVPTRPALPALTRVWLPEEFFVSAKVGGRVKKAGVRLDYNYFNGNLVGNRLYIPTQAPVVRQVDVNGINFTFDTRADFWLIARTKNVRAVVMLAAWTEVNGVRQYIPFGAETVTYYAYEGGFPVSDADLAQGNPGNWLVRVSVRATSTTAYAELGIVVRDLEARYAVQSRDPNGAATIVEDDTPHNLRHIYFEAWPDGHFPADPGSVLKLISVAKRELLENKPEYPTMVHCLAGHGRTGTLLSIVYALRTGRERGVDLSLHFLERFRELRKERYFLVQNAQQFVFGYSCYVLLLAAVQANNPNVLVIEDVKRIHAAYKESAPAHASICVRCFAPLAPNATPVVVNVEGAQAKFCTSLCSIQFVSDHQHSDYSPIS